jgi:hypothetical protein
MSEEEDLRKKVTDAVRDALDAGADLGITVTAEQVANAALDAMQCPDSPLS